MSVNIRGIKSKWDDLSDFIHKHNIKIGFLQEWQINHDNNDIKPIWDIASYEVHGADHKTAIFWDSKLDKCINKLNIDINLKLLN